MIQSKSICQINVSEYHSLIHRQTFPFEYHLTKSNQLWFNLSLILTRRKYSNMFKIFKRVFLLLSNHVSFFFNEFDPIKDGFPTGSTSKSNCKNVHYFLPLVASFLVVFQVAFGLEDLHSLDDLHFSFAKAITHKVFSGGMATQLDILPSIVVGILVLMLLNLMASPPFDEKHLMYQITDSKTSTSLLLYFGRFFNPLISQEILAFRRKIRRLIKPALICYFIAIKLYLYQQLYHRKYWNWNFQTFAFWVASYPFFLAHALFCK